MGLGQVFVKVGNGLKKIPWGKVWEGVVVFGPIVWGVFSNRKKPTADDNSKKRGSP